MIHARKLFKRFGSREVLRGLDLDVAAGAITLLVGANGAGKTTTLRLLAGLSVMDSGSVSIAGYDLEGWRRNALAHLSYLPQAPRFHPRVSVRQTAEFHAAMRGRTTREAAAALEYWGLRDHLEVATAKLSGGLRQRLALAVFSLPGAAVLLLDEPGLSLDPEWRMRLQDFLSVEASAGRTVLVATHLLGEWEGRGDRCILVDGGAATSDLPPERLREAFFRNDLVAAKPALVS